MPQPVKKKDKIEGEERKGAEKRNKRGKLTEGGRNKARENVL